MSEKIGRIRAEHEQEQTIDGRRKALSIGGNLAYAKVNQHRGYLLNRVDRLQAKIDALMLEYCPDEMTDDQLQEWGKHQVSAEPPE